MATGAAVLAMCGTAFAGTWKEDQTGWYWEENDGTYPAAAWSWIDGNQDGIAECYYFNDQGYLVTGTTTPDGSQVDAEGRWVVNGSVQTQGGSQAPADAAQGYAAALKKTNELDSFATTASVSMKMTSGAESYDVLVDMNMKVKDVYTSKIKILYDMNMSMMGENIAASMFYVDGYYYMDMLGSKIKMAMPMDEIMETTKSSSSGMMQDLEYLQDVQVTEDGAGNKVYTFICKTDSMNSAMGQILQGQMGVSDVSSMQIREYRGTMTVNAEGYAIASSILLKMDATVLNVPFTYDMKIDLNYINPGQPVDFVLPSTDGYTAA